MASKGKMARTIKIFTNTNDSKVYENSEFTTWGELKTQLDRLYNAVEEKMEGKIEQIADHMDILDSKVNGAVRNGSLTKGDELSGLIKKNIGKIADAGKQSVKLETKAAFAMAQGLN